MCALISLQGLCMCAFKVYYVCVIVYKVYVCALNSLQGFMFMYICASKRFLLGLGRLID